MSWTSSSKRFALADLVELGAVSSAEMVADRAGDATAVASDRLAELVEDVSEETARPTAVLVVLLVALTAVGFFLWRRRDSSDDSAAAGDVSDRETISSVAAA